MICLYSSLQLDRLARTARIYPAVRVRLASTHAIILSRRDRLAHVFPLVLGPYLRNIERLSFFSCLLRPLHSSFFVMLPQYRNSRCLSLGKFYLGKFAEFQGIVHGVVGIASPGLLLRRRECFYVHTLYCQQNRLLGAPSWASTPYS